MEPRDTTSLMHHRPFVLFLLARVFSVFAFQVSSVAVGWQIYALTGSAFHLGMVGLCQFVPMVFLTLVVGHAADRYDRRTIIRICQAIEGCAVGALAVGIYTDWLHVAGIFAAVTVLGAARSFEHPTMAALLPRLVPPSLLPKGTAMASSAMQTVIIVGPALGGLLYAVGPTVPFAVAATFFFLASLFASMIRVKPVRASGEPQNFRSVFSGIAFIRSRPEVLGAISLDLFAVLLGGATALLPVYARDILHTGPWGLGVLRSSPAVGALTMSLILTRRPLDRRAGRGMFVAVIVFGLATVVFALSTSMVLSVAALVILGGADVVSVVVRVALVQLATPDHMRGRVSAVNSLFIGTSNQLGEFESGVTAALLGTVPAVVLGGVGTILVAFAWMRMFPELRDVGSLEELGRAEPQKP